MRRTVSLIHRGYLYAQKRVQHGIPRDMPSMSELRMFGAKSWRDGYLAAKRDARKKS